MKILHILDHSIPLHSGYTFRTRSILREQRKLGWDTAHVTSAKHNQAAGEVPERQAVEGMTFYRTASYMPFLSKVPVLNQLLIVRGLQKRLDKVIENEEPDILHAHSPALNGVAAVLAGRKWKIPVVYEIRAFWEDAAVDHGTATEGNLRYRLTRKMETWVIQNAQAVTTICEGLRKDIINRGVPESKVTVIPNAVDLDKFSVIERKDEALLESLNLKDKFVVGFIGSFYGYEGLGLLIDALKILRSSGKEFHLLLVGGGPDEHKLREQVEEKHLNEHVTFTGRVPHEEVNAYYSVIDVLAYPRLSMRLTELVTPLKPLEAMAQKSLFVASDVGGHHELVFHKETGMLFKAGDAQDLANQILHLQEDEGLRNTLKQNGRKFVEQVRNWKNSVANYKSIYPKLIAKAGSQSK